MTTVVASIPVLRWAAQRAKLNDDSLAARFHKRPLWLSGEAQPTLKQLEDFARLTHTAFGYFFLPQPPVLQLPVPDFRTLRDEALAEPSSELLDTLYLCQQRQDWFRDHARIHGLPALPFVGSAIVREAPQAVAQRLREALGLSAEARGQLPTWTDALRQLIAKAEDVGVMVMVSSAQGTQQSGRRFLPIFGRAHQQALCPRHRRQHPGGHDRVSRCFRMLGMRKTATFYQAARELGAT